MGATAFSGSAAALNASIGASNVNVGSNDRGEVTKGTTDPGFRVDWRNFDQAVAKMFYRIEAAVADSSGRGPNHPDCDGEGYRPVFRATPWISGSAPARAAESASGTTGRCERDKPLGRVLANDSRSDAADRPRALSRAIELFNREGRPDYEHANYDDLGGVDADSSLDGTSTGGAGDAEYYLGSGYRAGQSNNGSSQNLPLVNNFPGPDAGYYGAAGDTDAFRDATESNQQKVTRVFLRYTFELQRPSGDPETGAFSGFGIPASDFDTGNGRIVSPEGELGNYDFTANANTDPRGRTYDQLHYYADNHVGIAVAETNFLVTVGNESSVVGVSGSSGTGGQAPSNRTHGEANPSNTSFSYPDVCLSRSRGSTRCSSTESTTTTSPSSPGTVNGCSAPSSN